MKPFFAAAATARTAARWREIVRRAPEIRPSATHCLCNSLKKRAARPSMPFTGKKPERLFQVEVDIHKTEFYSLRSGIQNQRESRLPMPSIRCINQFILFRFRLLSAYLPAWPASRPVIQQKEGTPWPKRKNPST
jgi:hypothetical protein